LVRGWIALSYAAGQRLMAPHHQWCYTPEKGTHWYDGPAERFAPMYRFVREHSDLFDPYETHADMGIVLPHRSFLEDPDRWICLCSSLAAANVSFRILLAGDGIVDCHLASKDLSACGVLLAPERSTLDADDARRLEARRGRGGVVATVGEALEVVRRAVSAVSPGAVRLFPRTARASAVVHVVNYAYDAARDDVSPQQNVRVTMNLRSLGIPGARSCRLVRPDRPDAKLPMADGTVTVPELDLWAILQIQ
jgi:hypothetical protein